MRFLLLGAGGFAKEVADLVESLGHTVVACYQESDSAPEKGHETSRIPTVTSVEDVAFEAAALAVGRPDVRERFMKLLPMPGIFPTLVHSTAEISPHSTLGEGILVMQNVVVNADAFVEDGVLLNVGCCVAHDCRVGAYSHLAPATQLGGGSSVGRLGETGTSTVVLPNVHLQERVRTGAGAIVTKDVEAGCTVVGVPARVVKRS